MKIKKHVIDKHLDDIERYSAFYNQTGMEKLFESVQGSKDMVWGLIEKQQQEIERIIGWCCTECDENFYLPKNSQTEQCLSVIHCPYCGGWGHTVLNTIPEKVK